MHTRKTKIVATIGRTSSGDMELYGMIHTGMNGARIDLSEASYEEHQKVIAKIRAISDKLHTAVAVIQDRDETDKPEVSEEDLEFAIANKVDFITLPNVKKSDNVKKLRESIKKKKGDVSILARIETKEAVEDLDAIILASDGLIVDRDILSAIITDENVTLLQKVIIKKAIGAGKPVIIATKMLESMISDPAPTGTEVNEVTNAILDGTDAILLSEETSFGRHVVLTIETLSRIALNTERSAIFEEDVTKFERDSRGIVDAVSEAAAVTAKNVGAEAIIALSEKGFTPRMIARFKPIQPIFVLTPHVSTYRKIILSFGCAPEMIESVETLHEAISLSKKLLERKKLLRHGDRFVLAAGIPFGQSGGTNMISIQTI